MATIALTKATTRGFDDDAHFPLRKIETLATAEQSGNNEVVSTTTTMNSCFPSLHLLYCALSLSLSSSLSLYIYRSQEDVDTITITQME
jgi:hypothetical protein